MSSALQDQTYLERFRGRFSSTLRWHQFDALLETLETKRAAGWYVYHVGDEVPDEPLSAEAFSRFLTEVSALLRREHEEDYCGIVYADSLEAPAMVKVYDPNNLGVSCGYSDNPPLPGWVLSLQPPERLEREVKPTGSRRRWWQRLFS